VSKRYWIVRNEDPVCTWEGPFESYAEANEAAFDAEDDEGFESDLYDLWVVVDYDPAEQDR